MASHFKELRQAKKEFKNRTGENYDRRNTHKIGLRIFTRPKKLNKRYFLGTYSDWLNL